MFIWFIFCYIIIIIYYISCIIFYFSFSFMHQVRLNVNIVFYVNNINILYYFSKPPFLISSNNFLNAFCFS